MTGIVTLTCREEEHDVGLPTWVEVPGARFEHVEIRCPSIEFASTSDREYLALHHIRLLDGETALAEDKAFRLLDLRGRLTFAPRGAAIKGWSQFERSAQAYTALSLDPQMLLEDDVKPHKLNLSQPLLYFQDANLSQTIGKIQRALLHRPTEDTLLLETLAIIATIEVGRLRVPALFDGFRSGTKLTPSQARLLREYIEANVSRSITLAELANLIGLSRFHFTRSFANTFGVPPYKYVLQTRIERAKRLLDSNEVRIKDVARLAGFSSANQFSRLFLKQTSQRPSDYRRR